MSKRFTDTEKWKDDWFLSLSNDYRIVWQWLLDNCNHAGICKPSINLLNMMCNTKITDEVLFEVFNDRLFNFNSFWFIPKFLKFQYGSLNSKKPAVISVIKELKKHNLIHLIMELLDNDYETITESLPNDYNIIKDKDKDKDKDKVKDVLVLNGKKYLNTDFKILPEQYIISSIQQIKLQKQQTITADVINQMWDVFKLQNLTGDKFYNNENEVYKHFGNWIKNQKFEKNGTKPTNEARWDARVEWANQFNSKGTPVNKD
jgi:hypothetical protein